MKSDKLKQPDMVSFLPKVKLKSPIAAVDLGGNSLEWLVLSPDNTVETAKFPVMSGKSIGETGRISLEAEAVLQQVFTQALQILKDKGVSKDRIYAVATSGLRDAANGSDMAAMANRMGLPIQIIDGVQEAGLVYRSVMKRRDIKPDKPYLVFEMGGGSTELAFGVGPTKIQEDLVKVLPFGTSRLGLQSHRDIREIQAIRQVIRQHLKKLVTPETIAAAKGRPVFMKLASEFEAFRDLLLENGEDIAKRGLSLETIAKYLTPKGLEKIDKAIKNGIFSSEAEARKLLTKLIAIHEVLSMLKLSRIEFGPSWGLKVGVLEALLMKLKAQAKRGEDFV